MSFQKLSDVAPIKAFFLNKQKLNNYVFSSKDGKINDKISYDIAIVLGCKNYKIMKHRIDEAILLYKKGIVKKLLLSGGNNILVKKLDTESSFMKKYVLNNRINEKDVIVEDKSKTTYQNMTNSIKEIKKICKKDSKIVIITSDFHIKRSKAILEKLTPLEIYSCKVFDRQHDIDKWTHSNISSRILIRTEAFLLSYYVKKGLINDQPIR